MKRLRTVLLGLIAAAALAHPLRAQDYPRLVVEGRGGLAFPLGDFRSGSDASLPMERAPALALHFVYRGLTGWGAQLGFSQLRFDCSASGCPDGKDVMTAWDIGAQRTFGAQGPVWLRTGLLFGRLERELALPGASAGQPSQLTREVSLLSLGAEAGGGVRIPIRGRLSLTPGARYGWLNTKFANHPVVRMRWLAADLGIALGF
jgi:hypothetical protein